MYKQLSSPSHAVPFWPKKRSLDDPLELTSVLKLQSLFQLDFNLFTCFLDRFKK